MKRIAAVALTTLCASGCQPPLVAWYTFDECDGTDSSGNERHGSVNGAPDCVPGVLGEALAFDGYRDNVVVSDFPVSTNAITVAFWFNPRDLLGGRRIVEHSWSAGTFMTNIEDGGVEAVFNSPLGPTPVLRLGRVTAREWYHMAFSYDGRNGEAYLDGALVDSFTTSRGIVQGAWDLTIGSRDRALYRGELDDLRVYGGALSQGKIQSLYEEGRAPGP